MARVGGIFRNAKGISGSSSDADACSIVQSDSESDCEGESEGERCGGNGDWARHGPSGQIFPYKGFGACEGLAGGG